MTKRNFSILTIAAAILAASSASAQERGLYASIKLFDVHRALSNMTLTSPRVTDRTQDPKSINTLNGSLSLGHQYDSPFRAEVEYTLPSSARYVGRWAPFNANDNVLHTRTQRLMLNGYAHFPVGQQLSLYGMLGVGAAVTRTSGWQTRPHLVGCER